MGFFLNQNCRNPMVSTFFSIPHDDLNLAASIRPALPVAIKAQEETNDLGSAQTPARCMVDKFMEEACAADLRLEQASKAVQEADEKLIEHAKK